jgi:hypothetical protein
MRISRMQFTGANGRLANAQRQPASMFIEVELVTEADGRTHRVQADDREDLWSMAEVLQHALDGYRGTRGDVHSYFMPLELMSDL